MLQKLVDAPDMPTLKIIILNVYTAYPNIHHINTPLTLLGFGLAV